jgi:hypothetical protein
MTWTLENKTLGGLDPALKPAVVVPTPHSKISCLVEETSGGSIMNTYDRLLFSLLLEFKRQAQPQVRSLWADMMELVEAIDERALSTAREQAFHRVRVLGRAASAAHADQVQSLGQELELMLGALMQAPTAACPELFESLYETMRQLTGAVYSIDVEAPVPEHAGQPTELTLVGSCAD